VAAHVKRAFLQFDRRTPPLIDLGEPLAIDDGLSLMVSSSGTGKTTLLRLMAGWYEKGGASPAAFEFEADYDPLSDVEFVGNHQTLLPWYSVRHNIALRTAGTAEAEQLWDALALPPAAIDLYPYELSLGMYKRAELVAALCSDFRLLLLDEFFSSLDPAARGVSLALLSQVNLADRAIIVTTHNPEAFQVSRTFTFCSNEAGTVRSIMVSA
jgi:ABC-type nitrate/sulfonate/bicarbonate transport system ATPase subunit